MLCFNELELLVILYLKKISDVNKLLLRGWHCTIWDEICHQFFMMRACIYKVLYKLVLPWIATIWSINMKSSYKDRNPLLSAYLSYKHLHVLKYHFLFSSKNLSPFVTTNSESNIISLVIKGFLRKYSLDVMHCQFL